MNEVCEGSGREGWPSKAKLCCARSGGNLCFGVCFGVCFGFAVEVLWGSVLGCESGCVLGMWFEGVGPPCSLHLRGAIGVANRGALGVGKRGGTGGKEWHNWSAASNRNPLCPCGSHPRSSQSMWNPRCNGLSPCCCLQRSTQNLTKSVPSV